MNILLPDSWLREYLETKATPKQIKDCLSLCGPSVERVEKRSDDYIYEIEITSNRVDMASVLGIAREATAILPRFEIAAKLKSPKFNENIKAENSDLLPLEVKDENNLCYRVLAVVIDNVSVSKSPNYIRERLEKSGVRSLNNLIDITNYVMLELGHPTHVFDYDRIKTGKLIIRNAKKGEKIITLDGKEFSVDERDVVIDDGTGRIIDLPGIMGTENSVVTDHTKRIVLFIESNNPVNIRRTSMRLPLRTMAATLNEKHPDPEAAKMAMMRGIEMFQNLAVGKIKSNLIDLYKNPHKPKIIKITFEFINERLGIKLKKEEIIDILESLLFKVSGGEGELLITPPSFRQFDVEIPEDIVEEVARIYGYHNLPSRLMTGEIPISFTDFDQQNFEEKIKTILKYWGYLEVYHYSFISKDLIEKTGLNVQNHLKVANPLNREIEYMRISLFPSMLNTIVQNQDQKENLELFELAKVYLPKPSDLPDEPSMLLIVSKSGFYNLKGLVESLLLELGLTSYQMSPNTLTLLHPNISLEFWCEGKTVAQIGKLHPILSQNFNIKGDFFAAYLNIEEIGKRIKPTKKYTPIPLYPPVIEDLTFILPENVKIGPLLSEIEKISRVTRVEFIDRFKNQMTLKIFYQDRTKNLEIEEVRKIREEIISSVKSKFKARLKGRENASALPKELQKKFLQQ